MFKFNVENAFLNSSEYFPGSDGGPCDKIIEKYGSYDNLPPTSFDLLKENNESGHIIVHDDVNGCFKTIVFDDKPSTDELYIKTNNL